MIKFAVRAGLAGGAVYYVADQGVWKNSTETSKLYDNIGNLLKPYVQEVKAQLPIEIPELPNSSKISFVTKQYWNQGVAATFTYIGDFPSHVSNWTRNGIDAVKSNEEITKFLDSFSTAPPTSEPVKTSATK